MKNSGHLLFSSTLISLFAQTVGCTVLYYNKYYCIVPSILGRHSFKGSEGETAFLDLYLNADFRLRWFLTTAFFFGVIEAMAILLGNLNNKKATLLYLVIAHSLSTVLLFTMVLEGWRYQSFLVVLIVGSVIPGVLCGIGVLEQILLKSTIIKRFEIRI